MSQYHWLFSVNNIEYNVNKDIINRIFEEGRLICLVPENEQTLSIFKTFTSYLNLGRINISAPDSTIQLSYIPSMSNPNVSYFNYYRDNVDTSDQIKFRLETNNNSAGIIIDIVGRLIYISDFFKTTLKLSNYFAGFNLVDFSYLAIDYPQNDNLPNPPEQEGIVPDEEYIPDSGSDNYIPLPPLNPDVGLDNNLDDFTTPEDDERVPTDEEEKDEEVVTPEFNYKWIFKATYDYKDFYNVTRTMEHYFTDEPQFFADICLSRRYTFVPVSKLIEMINFSTLEYPVARDSLEKIQEVIIKETEEDFRVYWYRHQMIAPTAMVFNLRNYTKYLLFDHLNKIIYYYGLKNVYINLDQLIDYRLTEIIDSQGATEEEEQELLPTNPNDNDNTFPPDVKPEGNVVFYRNNNDNNYIISNLDELSYIGKFDFAFINTDLINPVIKTSFMSLYSNLVYIDVYKRFYYIEKFTQVNGIQYEYQLKIDVLTSYYSAIRQARGFMNRSTKGSALLPDEYLIKYPYTITQELTNDLGDYGGFGVTGDINTGNSNSYVIQVASPKEV